MIRTRLSRPPADPYEAAAWWSARRRLGLAGVRDEEAFAEWLADPANAMAWQATEGALEDVGVFAALPELREMREAALAARPARPRSAWWAAVGAIAASLILGFFALAPQSPFAPAPAPIETASSVERFTTGIGEHRILRLSDGSRINLNTGSVLEVGYSAARRDVRLLSGQALFKVARDTSRPFTVAAGDRRIIATGTEFDVRIGDRDAVTVLLVEGRVRVEPVRREGIASVLPAAAAETLDPGQRLQVAGGRIEVAAADIERETSWTRGQIIFRDDRLADAVAEVNRYSTDRLVVTDPRVADLRVSGAFASGSTGNFVAAVTAFYPVDARRESPRVTVLAWRDGGR